MNDNKFQIIQELMDELKKEMQYSPDDLDERLGRKKPAGVEVVKLEGDMGGMKDPDMDKDDDSMPMSDSDGDMGMMESPEDKLKKRLMRLRG